MRWPRTLRFTRLGGWVVFLTLAIGLGAINTGNNLVYLVFGMLLGFILASGVVSEGGLRGLEADWILPGRVHAGQPAVLRLILINHKSKSPSFALKMELDASPSLPAGRLLYVPPGGRRSLDIPFTPGRRGKYSIRGVKIETQFPFGFFRKSRTIPCDAEFLIYPRVHPIREPREPASSSEKNVPLPRRGSGDSFWGLRDFREGDSPRFISWKTSAKQSRLVIWEAEKETDRRIVLSLGPRRLWRELTGEEVESALSFAASLAREKIRDGFAVGLRCEDALIPPAPGERNLDRIYSFLALFTVASPPSLSTGEKGKGDSEREVLDLWKQRS